MCDLPKSLREDEITIGLYSGMGIYEQVLPQGAWSFKGRFWSESSVACEVTWLMIESQHWKMVVPGTWWSFPGGILIPGQEASLGDLPGTKWRLTSSFLLCLGNIGNAFVSGDYDQIDLWESAPWLDMFSKSGVLHPHAKENMFSHYKIKILYFLHLSTSHGDVHLDSGQCYKCNELARKILSNAP